MAVADAPIAAPDFVDVYERLKDYEYPEFAEVELTRHFVDPRYQRKLTNLVNEIAANYFPPLVGTVITSERAGRAKANLAIIDGQHRWVGATRAKGIEHIPTLIYRGLTQADEADLFALLQDKRRNLTSWQRFRSRLVAGNPDALAMAAIVESTGWVLNADSETDSVRAIGALRYVYNRSPELLRDTMQVIASAWGTERDNAGADVIRGLSRFIEDEDPDLERLTRRLSTLPLHVLRGNAMMLNAGKGGGAATRALSWSEAIAREYAKRR